MGVSVPVPQNICGGQRTTFGKLVLSYHVASSIYIRIRIFLFCRIALSHMAAVVFGAL